MSFSRYLATTMAMLRMIFRRRITLFWSLVFPIILMTLLGLLFGRTVDAGDIAVTNVANLPVANHIITTLDAEKGVTIDRAPDAPRRATR